MCWKKQSLERSVIQAQLPKMVVWGRRQGPGWGEDSRPIAGACCMEEWVLCC